MINYGKQNILRPDINSVIKALKSNFLTQGPYVDIFQDKIKKYFGAKYCTVVSNGTAGLYIAGKALNWKKGDYIITTPITFVASANSIILSGAKPILVDIENEFYNLDPNKVEDKLKKTKKKIKAVVAVDYAGHPCDWEALRYLSSKFGFKLINDNCHAMGAKYKNKKNYAIKFADIVIHSYHPVKNFTTGEGGSLLTNDQKLNKKFLNLRNQSIIKNKKFDPWYYRISESGLNFRLSDLQCALGASQINHLDKFVKKRNEIASYYNLNFKNFDNLKLPLVRKDSYHAFHLYPLLINFKKIGIDKKVFFKKMMRKGINLQVHYIPLHYQPLIKKICNINKGDLPISENFYKKEVSIPIYPSLSLLNLKKAINAIKNTINKK